MEKIEGSKESAATKTLHDLAGALGISYKSAQRMVYTGHAKATKFGGKGWRVTQAEIDRLMKDGWPSRSGGRRG